MINFDLTVYFKCLDCFFCFGTGSGVTPDRSLRKPVSKPPASQSRGFDRPQSVGLAHEGERGPDALNLGPSVARSLSIVKPRTLPLVSRGPIPDRTVIDDKGHPSPDGAGSHSRTHARTHARTARLTLSLSFSHTLSHTPGPRTHPDNSRD